MTTETQLLQPGTRARLLTGSGLKAAFDNVHLDAAAATGAQTSYVFAGNNFERHSKKDGPSLSSHSGSWRIDEVSRLCLSVNNDQSKESCSRIYDWVVDDQVDHYAVVKDGDIVMNLTHVF